MPEAAYKRAHKEVALECFDDFMHDNAAGIFFIGPEVRLKKLNRKAAEIFGFVDVVAAEDKPVSQLEFFFSQQILDRIYGLLGNDHSLRVNCFPGTNLQGHFAYYSLFCNRAHDEDNQTAGVFGIIQDVTEHVRGRQELKSRVDELSILSQISQVASSTLDTEEVLKVILTGVTARQGLGFNRAFLFLIDDDGKTFSGRLAIGPTNAEDAGRIWSSLENDPRTLTEILSLYKEESQKTNRDLTDLINGLRIDAANGSLISQAIREKRSVLIDYDTGLDFVTEGFLSRLGEKQVVLTPLVSRDRVIGLLAVDNAITKRPITEDDRQFLKMIADQTAAAVERSYLYRDLKERALELEKINCRLAETQNQIIEAEKMSVIGEITSAVAHELRNPLTIIGGFANMMHKNLGPNSTDTEYLNIIVSETQRAEAVLTDVLDFSKASKTEGRRLDLNEMVGKSIDMLSVRLGNGWSRISFSPATEKMPIWGNPDQLLHAFYQVFQVIGQEMPGDGWKAITCRLGDVLRMEVSSPVRGKVKDSISKTLHQYFATGSSTKRLNLLVAEETLKHHGGHLGVESNPGEGPVLYVELPLHKEVLDG